MTTGEKIKSIRSQMGLTQKELAEIAGISEISVRKYEMNNRTPKLAQLNKLAEALGVNIDLLAPDKPLSLECKTIGEILSLLRALDNAVGIKFTGDRNESGYLKETDEINITISNTQLSGIILEWDKVRQDYYLKVLGMDKEKSRIQDWLDLDWLQQRKLVFEKNMCDLDEPYEKTELQRQYVVPKITHKIEAVYEKIEDEK